MAFNPDTQSYPENYLSKFPGAVCNAPDMVDLPSTLRVVAEQYVQAFNNNDIATTARLKSQYPDLEKSEQNAQKYNTLLHELKSTQTFFKDEVYKWQVELVQNALGLNDNASGDDEKLANGYSAYKIEYMMGRLLESDVIIPTSSWVNSGDSLYPYKYVYENSTILETDETDIYFDDESKFYASKAFVILKSNSGAGNITLLAKKIPKASLTISEIRIRRW